MANGNCHHRRVPLLFDSLEFFTDEKPHSAPVNMAVDEVILRVVQTPALRIYRWERPAISFGYFEKFAAVEKQHPDRELVRRWTGGGIVPHGVDFTYSLFVPTGSPFLQLRAADSYCAIHQCVAEAMQRCGMQAAVAPSDAPKISQACFENPVRHDVLSGDRKIAGAAQRRTRFGLLHQGSIQARMPDNFGDELARTFSNSVVHRSLTTADLEAAYALAADKYASTEWMQRF
jgi:lipoyl(octanoyl) transferase